MTKTMDGTSGQKDGYRENVEAVAEQLRQHVAAIERVREVLAVMAGPRTVGGDEAQWASDVARTLTLAAMGVDGSAMVPNAPVPTRRTRPLRALPSTGRYDASGLFLDETPMAVVEIATAPYRNASTIVAVGIDPAGHKRVIGYGPGSTYDRVTAAAICQELYARGLCAPDGTRMMVVTDGAAAIDQAFVERFPRAVLAHCQRAVEEGILAHLAVHSQEEARRELRSAWRLGDTGQAEGDLRIVCAEWAPRFPGGTDALWAQLDPTLTTARLGLLPALRRTLATLCVLRTAVTECRRLGSTGASPGQDPLPLGVEAWHNVTRRVIGHEGMAALARILSSAPLSSRVHA